MAGPTPTSGPPLFMYGDSADAGSITTTLTTSVNGFLKSYWKSAPPVGTAIDRSSRQALNLRHFWPCYESGGDTVHDIIGQIDLTRITTTAGWQAARQANGSITPGDIPGAEVVPIATVPEFDGNVNESFNATTAATVFDSLTRPFSVSIRFFMPSSFFGTFPLMFAAQQSATSGGPWEIFMSTSGSYEEFSFGNSGSYSRIRTNNIFSGTAALINRWHHIVVTYNGKAQSIGNYKLYLNSLERPLTTAGSFGARTNRWKIGGDNLAWRGQLCDVRVYDTEISASVVQEIHKNPFRIFYKSPIILTTSVVSEEIQAATANVEVTGQFIIEASAKRTARAEATGQFTATSDTNSNRIANSEATGQFTATSDTNSNHTANSETTGQFTAESISLKAINVNSEATGQFTAQALAKRIARVEVTGQFSAQASATFQSVARTEVTGQFTTQASAFKTVVSNAETTSQSHAESNASGSHIGNGITTGQFHIEANASKVVTFEGTSALVFGTDATVGICREFAAGDTLTFSETADVERTLGFIAASNLVFDLNGNLSVPAFLVGTTTLSFGARAGLLVGEPRKIIKSPDLVDNILPRRPGDNTIILQRR